MYFLQYRPLWRVDGLSLLFVYKGVICNHEVIGPLFVIHILLSSTFFISMACPIGPHAIEHVFGSLPPTIRATLFTATKFSKKRKRRTLGWNCILYIHLWVWSSIGPHIEVARHLFKQWLSSIANVYLHLVSDTHLVTIGWRTASWPSTFPQ